MEQKDPKDMTASELLRWLADDNDQSNCRMCHLFYSSGECGGNRCSDWKRDLADKIDAEIVKAYSEKLDTCAMRWAKANGWPDFRDGEDFGAWLDRCALMRPRYDNGDPVDMEDFGDPESDDFAWYTVSDSGDWTIYAHAISPDPIEGDISERVERPAPEVLGADGKPIVVGETVYRLSDGEHLEVLMPHGSTPETFDLVDCCGELERPSNLTHERPVQGADGLPVKVGETVWLEKDGRKGIVKGIGVNGSSTAYVEWEDGRWSPGVLCDHLTHTPPDTQERIDDDATMHPAEYCAVRGIDLGDDPDRESATASMVRDLLRRQRELDKRTGGE